MKNVLAIYYTQSGQLEQIANHISKPFAENDNVSLTFHEIKIKKPFPFPWTNEAFFDAFPESFLQIPTELEPIPSEIVDKKYDLILFFYQVWYLSPSIPINSFLKSPEAKILLKNTPVVTINGSRNMWIMAQEKVKVLLKKNNAQLKGNIALVDRAGNLISVITIVEWMFTGIKKKYLGIFPLPGVSEKDIIESEKFGETILTSLLDENLNDLQPKLIAQNAVKIKPFLITVDQTGNKIFNKWANFIIKKKNSRKNWLKIFKLYLMIAIWVISPIVYILHLCIFPFRKNKILKETHYYQGV
ncbi:MAG TPA: hypothetical protein VN192_04245 [Flavobacterium sp.]|nr:hypothetical protein [Flavobacterium sp.]